MEQFPQKLALKLSERDASDSLRRLSEGNGLVDFSSNDYLGLARSEGIYAWAGQLVSDRDMTRNGSTGSRLLTGNHCLYEILEDLLNKLHHGNSLMFNSGYDANIGFFASVPQRGDKVFYDEKIHASIRDGIRIGLAKGYKFQHNNLEHLRTLLDRTTLPGTERFVVTETVFSMDGDTPDLEGLVSLCRQYKCRLVVDEAHALGVMAEKGMGLLQQRGLHDDAFARILTFGKAFGAHGAAIVGELHLREYLLNFARSFIYTTAMPPHSVATLLASHHFMATGTGRQKYQELQELINYFRQTGDSMQMASYFTDSRSAIQCCLLPGNSKVKEVSRLLKGEGFDVRPILSPTVPEGTERLRFCLHSFNSKIEIRQVLELLHQYVSKI